MFSLIHEPKAIQLVPFLWPSFSQQFEVLEDDCEALKVKFSNTLMARANQLENP